MEARKIVIVSTRNQSKNTIVTGAETLSQLKEDLRNNNIDYEGMTFYEGTSKTELLSDDSPLPRDVMYKGQPTNNLVFMLTNSNKKIESGATTREEVYKLIKQYALQAEVKMQFGENFTRVKTSDLEKVINEHLKSLEEPEEDTQECCGCPACKAVAELAAMLWDYDVITKGDVDAIHKILGAEAKSDSLYSDEEIQDMFNFMN